MSSRNRPEVAILILNYNGLLFLRSCIDSLEKVSYSDYTIFVIDNGSIDGSVSYLRQHHPNVKIIAFDKNLGFPRAYNEAIRSVAADLLLILNNDIEAPSSNFLDEMVNLLTSDPNIGVVGPKLLRAENASKLDCVGGDVYRWLGSIIEEFDEKDTGQYDNPPKEPFYVSGASLLIRKNLFEKLGGFDSELFAYCEDLDLCWRLRLIGFRIAYCPSAVLVHHRSASWNKSFLRFYLSSRNFLYVCLKNYSFGSIIKELPFFFMVSLLGGSHLVVSTKNFGYFAAFFRSISANLINFKHIYQVRKKVQMERTVPESIIVRKMNRAPLPSLSKLFSKTLNVDR